MTFADGPPAAPSRRSVLAGALAAAAGALPAVAHAADPDKALALPGSGDAFEANTLTDLARARAAAPYVGPKSGDVPAVLKTLSREAYAAIHPADGRAVWADRELGYTLEPLLRGAIFETPVLGPT